MRTWGHLVCVRDRHYEDKVQGMSPTWSVPKGQTARGRSPRDVPNLVCAKGRDSPRTKSEGCLQLGRRSPRDVSNLVCVKKTDSPRTKSEECQLRGLRQRGRQPKDKVEGCQPHGQSRETKHKYLRMIFIHEHCTKDANQQSSQVFRKSFIANFKHSD